MRKLWKFALVGGTVGAGVTVARSMASEGESNDTAGQAVRVGGQVAAAGAVIGLMLDRRASKKARSRAGIFDAVRAGSLAEAAKAARPVIEHAVEVARPRLEKAAADTRMQARKHARRAAARAHEALESGSLSDLAERTPALLKIA